MNPAVAMFYNLAYTMYMSKKALQGKDKKYVQEVALRWAKNLCLKSGVEVRAHGVGAVDWDRPLVVASNHQSFSDIPVIMTGINRPFGFLTKSELFRIPAFGEAMLRLGCVSIDRGDREKAYEAIEAAGERLREGSSIVVFPEGTRSERGVVRAFKKGPFYLAQAAGVSVVPVGLVGTDRVIGKGGVMVRPAQVDLYVGEPIACAGSSQEARDELREGVRAKILEMTGLEGG